MAFLTKKQLAAVKRAPGFKPDKLLPAGFIKLVHKDYTGSGLTEATCRRHSDRNPDKDMNDSTFVMTNIVGQSHDLNALNAWNGLENPLTCYWSTPQHRLCLGRSRRGAAKWIQSKAIAHGKVAAPAHCWKVIMAWTRNDGKASDV